jgi:hypothetical protein
MSEWVWQGFYGPSALVIAAKAQAEQLPVSVVGVVIPPTDHGVVVVDAEGVESMYAVQTRADAPLPTPEGLRVARPELVGRLVGA